MAIENFDHGANKAAGVLTIGENAGTSALRGIGVRGGAHDGGMTVRVELVDGIAHEDFLAFGQVIEDQGMVSFEWVDPFHIDVSIWAFGMQQIDDSCWFVFYALSGAGLVPITPPPFIP